MKLIGNVIPNKAYVNTQKIEDPEIIELKEKTTEKKRKWLEMQARSKTKLGRRLGKKIPKYFLENGLSRWDISQPRNRAQLLSIVSRDWIEWNHELSQTFYILGKVTDPNNPVYCEDDTSIHQGVQYGIFAIEPIPKYTVLFEYSGHVKRSRDAEAGLTIENEFQKVTLFELRGFVDKGGVLSKSDRKARRFWGKCPNDEGFFLFFLLFTFYFCACFFVTFYFYLSLFFCEFGCNTSFCSVFFVIVCVCVCVCVCV